MTPVENNTLALKTCPACESAISPTALKCCHCGEVIKRKMSVLLTLGIIFIPLIFCWFTLRRGYSFLARFLSFAYLILNILFVIVVNPGERYLETLQQRQVPAYEQSTVEKPATDIIA